MLKTGTRGGWIVLMAVVALVLLGGLMPGQTPAKDVKELRIGIGIDADTLNPFEITTDPSRRISRN